MTVIDDRLLSVDTDQDITENFNRVLAMIDALEPETEVPSETPTETPSETPTETPTEGGE